jgi:Lrp/AsnC family transcriptional regulator, regulator for asnA, asnC and gidA
MASKHPENLQIDNVDKQIIALLTEDAMMPYTEVAKKMFVSSGTVHVRMKKLKEIGVIKRAELVIDHAAMGYDITSFLGIYLQKSSLYNQVVKALEKIPEVVECNYTTGNYSMFCKIICKDTAHLKEVLSDKIQHINGIERTETFISLEENINRPLKLVE